MAKELTKNNINVVVVGTGFIGPAHIEALSRNGIHVTGLVESSYELAKTKSLELGIP